MKIRCIYTITHIVTKEQYVGSTTDYERRKKRHFTQLLRGNHPNWKMQLDYNHNPECLIMEVLYKCDELTSSQIYDLEQGYINLKKYKYNLAKFTSNINSEGRLVNKLRRNKRKIYLILSSILSY